MDDFPRLMNSGLQESYVRWRFFLIPGGAWFKKKNMDKSKSILSFNIVISIFMFISIFTCTTSQAKKQFKSSYTKFWFWTEVKQENPEGRVKKDHPPSTYKSEIGYRALCTCTYAQASPRRWLLDWTVGGLLEIWDAIQLSATDGSSHEAPEN